MEFIPQPRESRLAELIAQMQASQMAPIAQGILQAGQAIGGGLSEMGERKEKQGTLRNNIMAILSEKGLLEQEQAVGFAGGMRPLSKGAISLRTLFPGADFPEGIYSRPPNTKTEETMLSETERNLLAPVLKTDPKNLIGVSRDVAKSMLPQTFVDEQGNTVISAPKGTKLIPREKEVIDKAMQREISKSKRSLAEANAAAAVTIPEIDRVEKLNENAYGGLVGQIKMKALSAGNITGNEKFKNTADVINTLKGMVAKVLKSTFGGQLSDSERAYLNEVYGAADRYSNAERAIAMQNIKTMFTRRQKEHSDILSELEGGTPAPSTIKNKPVSAGIDSIIDKHLGVK